MALTGKRALVIGGSRGIGAAIARRLAAEGADVALTYGGSGDAAEALAAGLGAEGPRAFHGDVADVRSAAEAVGAAAGALGGIDVLVYNAGVAAFAPIDEATAESFRAQFDVNVDGLFHSVKAALPHLADGGRIIVIGSINGDRMPTPGGGIYGGTKAAVQGLARGWARDLAPRGILVNVIQPGPVDTDMNPADGPFAEALTPLIPLGRYARAEEIAGAAAFLAGDDASFITGTTLAVDGGFGI